jgi:ssDNA-binding Zn-finger/Zn-ribbon topoisomerase 1
MEYQEEDKIQFLVEFVLRCGKCNKILPASSIRGVYIKLQGAQSLVVDFTCPQCGDQTVTEQSVGDKQVESEEKEEVTNEGEITDQEIDIFFSELRNLNMDSILKSLEE